MEKLLPLPYRKFDFVIFLATVILIIIGLSTIQSTIIANISDNLILNSNLIDIQILSITTGVLVFLVILFFNYRYLIYLSPFIYLAAIGLLGGVLYFGSETRGAMRWLSLGPIGFQPSTISAILFIITLAAFFASIGKKINRLPFLGLSILMLVLPIGLLLIEPDLGISIVVGLIWLGLLHLTPIKLSRLLLVYLIILLMIPVSWYNLADYQKERVLTFLTPSSNPLGSGYQARQAIIAVGSGQLFGRGWGRGTQSHLQFLPEQHTDFIFATFAEEQGFVGAIIVIFLYGLIIWRMFCVAAQTKDYFAQLLIVGVILWLSLHVVINIGMNLGLLPITGIPLPFLSYGGTAMVTAFIGVALVESVAIHKTDW